MIQVLELLGFWVYQILWVFPTSLPLIYFNSLEAPTELTIIAAVGTIMFIIGFTMKLADYTKLIINYMEIMVCGWSLEQRHPITLETVLWFGIFIFCFTYGTIMDISGLLDDISISFCMDHFLEASADKNMK